MKKVIFIVSILFLTSFLEKSDCSDSYKCLDSEITYNKNICAYEDNEKDIFYLRPCPDGYECILEVERREEKTVLGCQPIFRYKKEGDSCLFSEECETYRCKDNKCISRVIWESCKSDLDCSKDAYCNKGFCKVSSKEGEECDNPEGCLAGYYCGQKEKNATNQICIAEYSIPNGKYASNERLCESELLDNETNLCYDTESKVPEGTPCETNTGCQATKIVGETKTETTLSCERTWDQKNICSFGTKSERWKTYVSHYKTEMQKKKISYYRGTNPNEEWPTNVAKTNDWNINNDYFKTLPMFYNAPTCVFDFFNYGNSSNTEFIKFSFALLFCILLLI